MNKILKVSSLAGNGKGVGAIFEDGFNRPVFIAWAVPGDELEINVTGRKNIYYEAEIGRIVNPSPDRQEPVCPHFGDCGACDLLHIKYDAQVREKEKLLRHYFDKAGLPITELNVVSAVEHYNYRIRSRFQFRDGSAGFYAKKSHEVVPIEKCFIIKDELNSVFGKKHSFEGERSYAWDEQTASIVGESEEKPCFYSIGKHKLMFYPDTFAQNNLEMNKKMIDIVLENVKGKKFLDLYAGNGNFSIPLAEKGEVVCVEGDRKSFELMKKNIELNKAAGLKPVLADADAFEVSGYDCVVLDPPRTGAENIERIDAKQIIYISCSPQQLTKDLKKLKNYSLKKVFLIDMFPQTVHFEAIAILEKA